MALRPIHQWKLDKNYEPMRDKHGDKIPHHKAGQPKKLSEYTPAEKRSHDDAIRFQQNRRDASADSLLRQILDALETILKTQKSRAKLL